MDAENHDEFEKLEQDSKVDAEMQRLLAEMGGIQPEQPAEEA